LAVDPFGFLHVEAHFADAVINKEPKDGLGVIQGFVR
jgi:hypothetical protein